MNLAPKIKEVNFEERHKLKIENGKLLNISVDSIFELIRDIKDPEHAFTLEQLNVVKKEFIRFFQFTNKDNCFDIGLPINVLEVQFEPTIPHCSMAAIIGLSIKYFLNQIITDHIVIVKCKEGSHVNDKLINKQLCDKDRVQAAFENESLIEIINECLSVTLNKL